MREEAIMLTSPKTAKRIKGPVIPDYYGPSTGFNWCLWKMDPPHEGCEFVRSSAADTIDHGPETYLFPCDNEGNVTDWGELEGSFVGDMNHESAIRGAGYVVVLEGELES